LGGATSGACGHKGHKGEIIVLGERTEPGGQNDSRSAGLPYKRNPPVPVFCRQLALSFLYLCAQVLVPRTTIDIAILSKSPRSMEEETTPPRRNDTLLVGGMRATRRSSMRFTEPQGRTEEPPVPPRRSTRSYAPPPYTPLYSAYGFIILSEEEEKKLSRLENRLVANVDFDDQALNSLGFGIVGHTPRILIQGRMKTDSY
jgi:hypothetical protein